MTAASVHIHAWRVSPEDITADCRTQNDHAPILVMVGDVAMSLPRDHAVRLVDQLTAALAQLKASGEFHRGPGGEA